MVYSIEGAVSRHQDRSQHIHTRSVRVLQRLLPASLPPSNSMQPSFIWSAIRHPLVGGHAPAASETAVEDFPSLSTLSLSVEVEKKNNNPTHKQNHKPRKKLAAEQ